MNLASILDLGHATLIWAAVAGAALGAGLLLTFYGLPAMNRPRMLERVAPHVHMLRPSPTPTHSPFRGAARLVEPVLISAVNRLEAIGVPVLGRGNQQLIRRLEQANSPLTPVEYRMQQLMASILAIALAIGLSLAAVAAGSFRLLPAIVLVLLSALAGAAAREALLSARIKRRRARILTEFPAVAEMLALAVSAGETASGAFSRISRSIQGELSAEFQRVINRIQAGETFTAALRRMSTRIQDLPPVSRFFEGVVVAVERGTPLADVLHAQAADARELSKRELMESAGRKEVAMLVPLIFGILPLTVIFALFPGLALLEIGL